MLYAVLKGMSQFLSVLPYKFVVRLGRNCGKLYWYIAKNSASGQKPPFRNGWVFQPGTPMLLSTACF